MSQQQEPVEGSTDPFPFLEAVGPFAGEPDLGVADQTPHVDLEDAQLQAEADDFAANHEGAEVAP